MATPYSPDDLEWVSLNQSFAAALLGWVVLVAFAHGFKWTSWWYKSAMTKPWGLNPLVFSALFFGAQSLVAVGYWLDWREGHRSDLIFYATAEPFSGNVPSTGNFFSVNLLFLIYWIVSLGLGPSYFMCCLQYHVSWMPLLISVVLFGLNVALLVISYLIWWVPGILFSVSLVFWIYAICVAFMINRNHNHLYIYDPQDAMEINVYNTMALINANTNISKNVDVKKISNTNNYVVPTQNPLTNFYTGDPWRFWGQQQQGMKLP